MDDPASAPAAAKRSRRDWPRGWWRYIVPNAVTSLGIIFAVLAVQSALASHPVDAAWWAILVVLTDKADGFIATRLRATSEFGVQLDSLTDVIAFGVTPSAIVYGYYRTRPELGWVEGWHMYVLRILCALYVVAAALRLARFNVAAAGGGKPRHFSGVPTTMTAGFILAVFLMLLKYASPFASGSEDVGGLHAWKIFGGLDMTPALPYFPWILPLGAAAMLSSLPIPKLGRTFSRITDGILLSAVLIGYSLGVARRMPEVLTGGTLYYFGIAVVHGLRGSHRAEPGDRISLGTPSNR